MISSVDVGIDDSNVSSLKSLTRIKNLILDEKIFRGIFDLHGCRSSMALSVKEKISSASRI